MRLFHTFVLFALGPLASLIAQSSPPSSGEKDAVAVVQHIFDGMAAHDAALIRSVMLPDARLFAIRDNGAPVSTAAADFASQIAANQSALVERFTGQPKVLIRGRMAQVWGEYEFLRDGKFQHCGVDSVSLLKTADGWKVAAIAYTSETTGCKAP
ncbi:MAG TPA: nuclear transport factor 2 family protein [Bryobacteraceae bacterium]|nr:nuclear transport factor 2 family protein [Bryobacteraceae bacterium]